MSALGTALKILLPVGAVVGVGVAMSGGDSKKRVTRHGVTMVDDCLAFEVTDYDAAVEWLRAYKLPGQLDDEPEQLQATLVGVMKAWWPECTWPPVRHLRPGEGGPQETTFGGKAWAERLGAVVGWADNAKKNGQRITVPSIVAVFFGLGASDLELGDPGMGGDVVSPPRKPDDQPKPVKPIPPIPPGHLGEAPVGPDPSEALPANWVSLDTAQLFAEFDVKVAMEPKAAPAETGDTPSAVLLGVSGQWANAPRTDTLERFLRLATNNPDITVAVFDLALARDVLGIDPGDLAWVATAIGPSGEFYPGPMVGRGPARPPAAGQLVRLREFADDGFRDGPQAKVYTRAKGAKHVLHTILVRPGNKGWVWFVWVGPRGFERDALKSGRAAWEMDARKMAEKFVDDYVTLGASTGS